MKKYFTKFNIIAISIFVVCITIMITAFMVCYKNDNTYTPIISTPEIESNISNDNEISIPDYEISVQEIIPPADESETVSIVIDVVGTPNNEEISEPEAPLETSEPETSIPEISDPPESTPQNDIEEESQAPAVEDTKTEPVVTTPTTEPEKEPETSTPVTPTEPKDDTSTQPTDTWTGTPQTDSPYYDGESNPFTNAPSTDIQESDEDDHLPELEWGGGTHF